MSGPGPARSAVRPGGRWAGSSSRALLVAVAAGALPFVVVLLFPSQLDVVMPASRFLAFHNTVEFFSAMVSFSIFGVGWFTHDQSRDRRSLFLSCAFLAVGLLVLLHAMTYGGMPDFITANTPTRASQYWICLRFLTAAAFLASAFMSARTPRWVSRRTLLLPALAVPAGLFTLISVFPRLVPATYVAGRGLTTFKVGAEYVIVALFLLAVLAYVVRAARQRSAPSDRIVMAIVLSVYAELVFTAYRSYFDTFNAIGHLYYLAAGYLVYREVFARSVREPYLALAEERTALEREIEERKRVAEALRASEQKLALHRDHLEELVAQRTAELSRAKDLAEKANRAKSVFLASMSHELRTPLNAVLGFSEIMRKAPDVTPSQGESLDIIIHSGEYLLSVINNVLDISKIESGQVELEECAVDLRQLIQNITSLMYVRATEKDLDFTLEEDPDLPRCVLVDAAKLRQVVLNLLGNAIKFTASGGVRLRAAATGGGADGTTVLRFEIVDTGPGVPQAVRGRIFEPFVQVGEQPVSESGSGLGLAISRQFVEVMGGRIEVTDNPGGGSVFSFEIPAKVVAADEAPVPSVHARVIGIEPGQPRYRVLIAEDQPANRQLLRQLLEPLGFEVMEAADGAEAVAQWERGRPDLIFMDIRMPVLDGLTATRRIKETEEGARTRIVAVTAHALEDEGRRILAAGCDDLIRKPYRDVQVLDALAAQLGVRFRYAAAEPGAPARSSLDVATLRALPDELLGRLEQALILIDPDAVRRVVDEIRAVDPGLADSLTRVAEDLQFGRILRMVKQARPSVVQEARR